MSNNINIDGKEYKLDSLSSQTKNNLSAIKMCDIKILDLKREIDMIKTARIGYGVAVKTELDANKAKKAKSTKK